METKMSSHLDKHIVGVDSRYVRDSNVLSSPVDFKRLLGSFVCGPDGYLKVPVSVINKEFDDEGFTNRNIFFFSRGVKHETRPSTIFVGSGSTAMGGYSSRVHYAATVARPYLQAVEGIYFFEGQDIMSWQVVELRRLIGKFHTLRKRETKLSEYVELVVGNRRV